MLDKNKLSVYSVASVAMGTDYNHETPMEPNTFGNCTFFPCSYIKEIDSYKHLQAAQLLKLNTTASYLIQIGDDQCYDCAISILEKIVDADSTLASPFLNLADAYWATESFDKAKESYLKYTELMKQNNYCDDIPSHVIERLPDK